ncbi:MAG TPA: aminopeptidase P N-terminal domain-containing protein [Candidatus Acidoferrum sp.]|nr:aminopeptidase P N-terminal domain-containing protein [Candidatus Acidoferrum sp.]
MSRPSRAALFSILFLFFASQVVLAQQRREREPNSIYASRRATLVSHCDGPVILWGFTGREEVAQTYIFSQEYDFYYLTGHNEEGAGVILLPPKNADAGGGPREMLFLPPKNVELEQWNGVRMSPTDPNISERTGFSTVKPFSEMRTVVESLARNYPAFCTILPYQKELGGYPHEKAVTDWLTLVAPQTKLKDIRPQIEQQRQYKSPGEVAFLQKAIDLSDDSHLAAMRMMRPGLFEYQVGAKMVEIHAMGGSESEGYAPIVGAGPNSTSLHYDRLDRKIQDGDIVVLDVGAQYSGYSADITRTIPANGKFTPRQREIYDVVLGAQNAAIAAIKPGANFCRSDKESLFLIAYNYINTHGKDLHGKPLGQYFIHGLGHGIGLDVHDPGESCRPLEPGMVITIEPGVYIPEEHLGVRIEDDFLITETGARFLSEKLPRDPDQIERIMAEAAASRRAANSSDADQIKSLVSLYTRSIDTCDTSLAAEVWLDSPSTTFIHPLGHEHGFAQIKENIYEKLFGQLFSERKLVAHDIAIDVSGDSAVVEFYWDFNAKFRKDGSPIATHGRETQIYFRHDGAWRLAHVHYSGMPATQVRQGV